VIASPGYRKVVVAAGIGSFIEIYDAVLYGYFATVLAGQFVPAADPKLMTFATMAFGLLPSYHSAGLLAPALLLVCRILQGLSVSAEIPGALARALATTKRRMLVLLAWTAASAVGGFLLAGFLPGYLIGVVGRSPADAFTANLVAIQLRFRF